MRLTFLLKDLSLLTDDFWTDLTYLYKRETNEGEIKFIKLIFQFFYYYFISIGYGIDELFQKVRKLEKNLCQKLIKFYFYVKMKP